MKNITKAIASLLIAMGMIFALSGCGGGGEKTPIDSLTIDINGTMIEGDPVTFTAVSSKTTVVSYRWTGDVAGDTQVITQVFAEGNYSATITVMDDNGATTTISKSFSISSVTVQRTFLEDFFDLDNLKTGDSIYWDGEWKKTTQSCQYSTIDVGNGVELDATSIRESGLKLHFTLIETEVDGKEIIGCSFNSHQNDTQYNDLVVAEYDNTSATFYAVSDESYYWVRANDDWKEVVWLK